MSNVIPMERHHGKRGRLPEKPLMGVGTIEDYQTAALPELPAKIDVPSVSWGMDGNDQWSDCVMAGTNHCDAAVAWIIQQWGAKYTTDVPAVATGPEVIAEYQTLTGAKTPGDANDTGLVITDVLKQWQQVGFFGSKLSGYTKVSLAADGHLRQGINLGGAVVLGVDLPDSAEQQFDAGQNWIYTGDPGTGGHEMLLVGFNGLWIQAITWGGVVNLGPEWISHYAVEAYMPLHSAFITAGRGAEILDISAIEHDMPTLAA